ncbi:MAG TPA: hypothetical protein VKA69_07910, partial [Desulfobacteria bacterium]|nr:hypothetical protein [Desulfobacteria bacterium]
VTLGLNFAGTWLSQPAFSSPFIIQFTSESSPPPPLRADFAQRDAGSNFAEAELSNLTFDFATVF